MSSLDAPSTPTLQINICINSRGMDARWSSFLFYRVSVYPVVFLTKTQSLRVIPRWSTKSLSDTTLFPIHGSCLTTSMVGYSSVPLLSTLSVSLDPFLPRYLRLSYFIKCFFLDSLILFPRLFCLFYFLPLTSDSVHRVLVNSENGYHKVTFPFPSFLPSPTSSSTHHLSL